MKTKDTKCPICESPDAKGYLSRDTICPCCGSDLAPLRRIHRLEQRAASRTVWVATAAIAILTAVAFGTLTFTRPEPIAVHDTLRVTEPTAKVESPETDDFRYVVRPGDSFWLISRRIYGTGTRAAELAHLNSMEPDDVLHVGDKLNVNLPGNVPN